MIFYFSGTGNSKFVASKIGEATNDELINIADVVKSNDFNFYIPDKERIGFVFPVYCWGVPSIVSEFAHKLNLSYSEKPYTFVIITCGGSIANASGMFEKMLSHTGLTVDAMYSHLMPDNYIPMYNIASNEESLKRLEEGNKILFEDIIPTINSYSKHEYKASSLDVIQTAILYPTYIVLRNTSSFYTTDACTSCGVCESICPSDTIKIEDGKPVWKNKKCIKCLACIHRCPEKAIQHGKGTEKRNRYVHPELK
ncbi:MAG: EFR1 family ferrodoxin [Oscillospiraceae bacterium]|nr:EFR1 family ferrodoxin [Oscillospiraceae bacterium]